jgi:glycosyltransferase involved in cell wall biosynthesis
LDDEDELIIVDDGSIDDSYKLINFFKSSKIKYIYQNNSGVSVARNVGINCAKNSWIAFLDSDDIWHSDKLSIQKKFHLENKQYLFSFTDETWLFNNKKIKKKKHQKKFYKTSFLDNISHTLIGTSTVMIHKSIFNSVGLFNKQLKVCEDYDMWLRILYYYNIGYIDKELTIKVAGHNDQLSFNIKLIDSYRIDILMQFIESKYKKEIMQEIEKKRAILLKCARKYNNIEIINKY